MSPFLPTTPPHPTADIDWTGFKATCLATTNSAPDLDQWAPADFALFSDLAYQRLTELLNLIEAGSPWPDGTRHAQASFLPKAPTNLADPIAYRVLLILPTIYRKWAATRLRTRYP